MVIPFNIGCGDCFIVITIWNLNATTLIHPANWKMDNFFGFGAMHGNHWGGQAEYLRVPFADFSSFKVPDSDLKDEQVLFLSDVVPTAYWSVEHAGVNLVILLLF